MKKTVILGFLLALILIPNTINAQKIGDIWKKVKKETVEGVNEVLKKKDSKNKKENPISKKEDNKEQNNSEHQIEFNENDFIVFKAPNEDFVSINLQKHKGLPRIGDIDSYGSKTSYSGSRNNELYELITKLDKDQSLFFRMIRTKYMTPYLKDIDRKILYKASYSMGEPNRDYKLFQSKLQFYLESLCFSLMTQNGKDLYFKNPNGYSNSLKWGGNGDEFAKTEAYRKFASTDLDPLIKWSEGFFINNSLEFYFVNSLSLGDYDYEKQSYELISGSVFQPQNISLSVSHAGDLKFPFGTYAAQNEFEYNINDEIFSNYKRGLLIKMDVEKAKQLKEKLVDYSKSPRSNGKAVFLVRKVKMETVKKRRTLNSQNGSEQYQEQEFSYSFSEPYAEIYADEALTDKIGTIQIFKN
ncbi:MAG: hypothetical protein KDC67_13475 [Ignavibacteriae bacterium]|nr:hypothetical protein [Ignavibacteriota bacterium]